MRRRLHGDLEFTELGFGGAQLGNLYRETSEEEAAGAVDAAWNAGIRYFDTAPHYGLGLSERRLGNALGGRARDAFLVSTKVGRLLVPTNEPLPDDEGFAVSPNLRRVRDYSRDGIRRSVDESLKRLALDRIDIVYLHDPDDYWEVASREGAPALAELRDEGVIGAFGAAMNQIPMLLNFIDRCDVDLVMVAGRHTLLEPIGQERLLPLAAQHGVGVVVAGVYNSGLLSRPRPSRGAKFNYEDAPDEAIHRAVELAERCEAHGTTLPAAAVQFPLISQEVVSVVIGARTSEQVYNSAENYQSLIDPALWDALNDTRSIPTVR